MCYAQAEGRLYGEMSVLGQFLYSDVACRIWNELAEVDSTSFADTTVFDPSSVFFQTRNCLMLFLL
jgi:hypothetical protein